MNSSTRKTAPITGAGRGIGAAFACRLARDGYDLVLVDLEPPQDTATEAVALGADVQAVAADISSESAVAALREQALDRVGRVEVLVNNASVGQLGSCWLHASTLGVGRIV